MPLRSLYSLHRPSSPCADSKQRRLFGDKPPLLSESIVSRPNSDNGFHYGCAVVTLATRSSHPEALMVLSIRPASSPFLTSTTPSTDGRCISFDFMTSKTSNNVGRLDGSKHYRSVWQHCQAQRQGLVGLGSRTFRIHDRTLIIG